MNYSSTLEDVGPSEAAMLVKWLLCPVRSYATNIAPAAHARGMFHRTRGLTTRGHAFAVEHLRREAERLAGRVGGQRPRRDLRCRSCRWEGRRTEGPHGFGECPKCGGALTRMGTQQVAVSA